MFSIGLCDRRLSNAVVAIGVSIALSACSVAGGSGSGVPVPVRPTNTMSFSSSAAGYTITANEQRFTLSSAVAGQPIAMPWATMTPQADGSADFRTTDGHVGKISIGSDGSTIVSMPWYSSTPVVIQKGTFDGLVAAGRRSAAQRGGGRVVAGLTQQDKYVACASLNRMVQSAQQAYNAAVVAMVVTFGAGIIADIATMGLALVAVGMNVAVLMAATAAASALQDAKDNAAAAGC